MKKSGAFWSKNNSSPGRAAPSAAPGDESVEADHSFTSDMLPDIPTKLPLSESRIVTDLDFTPLASRVTRRDIVEYMRATGRSPKWTSTVLPWLIGGVVGTVILGVIVGAPYAEQPSMRSSLVVVFGILFIPLWVYVIMGIARDVKRRPEHVRLSRFALTNGFTFTRDGSAPDYPGMIFTIGGEREVLEQLSSTTKPTFDVGNYKYVITAGRTFRTFRWGFMAVKLNRKLPHMIVDAKSNNTFKSNLPITFSKNQTLSLEGGSTSTLRSTAPKSTSGMLFTSLPPI